MQRSSPNNQNLSNTTWWLGDSNSPITIKETSLPHSTNSNLIVNNSEVESRRKLIKDEIASRISNLSVISQLALNPLSDDKWHTTLDQIAELVDQQLQQVLSNEPFFVNSAALLPPPLIPITGFRIEVDDLRRNGYEKKNFFEKTNYNKDTPNSEIENISISDTKFCSVTTNIGQFLSLKYLQLHCKLFFVPDEITYLINLVDLDLASNQLENLPSIGNLKNLKYLSLERNHLANLPDEIAHLGELNRLNLNKNLFHVFPQSIYYLANLVELALSDNFLSVLPEHFKNLKKLDVLKLNNNQFIAFPVVICKLCQLSGLHFAGNQISGLPEEIENMSCLRDLDLSHNKFTIFPSVITKINNIRDLKLNDNQLSDLPPEIGHCTSLVSLKLANNRLVTLTENIGYLTQLTKLDLENNKLTSIPDHVGNLSNLDELLLRANQLSSLPIKAMHNFTKLTKLTLSGNKLQSTIQLPDNLKRLLKDDGSCTIS